MQPSGLRSRRRPYPWHETCALALTLDERALFFPRLTPTRPLGAAAPGDEAGVCEDPNPIASPSASRRRNAASSAATASTPRLLKP